MFQVKFGVNFASGRVIWELGKRNRTKFLLQPHQQSAFLLFPEGKYHRRSAMFQDRFITSNQNGCAFEFSPGARWISTYYSNNHFGYHFRMALHLKGKYSRSVYLVGRRCIPLKERHPRC
jgi:hypothetical protein